MMEASENSISYKLGTFLKRCYSSIQPYAPYTLLVLNGVLGTVSYFTPEPSIVVLGSIASLAMYTFLWHGLKGIENQAIQLKRRIAALMTEYKLNDDFNLAVNKIGRPELVAKIGKISGLAGLFTTTTSFILKLIALGNPDDASSNNALTSGQIVTTVSNGAFLLTGFITYVKSGAQVVNLITEEIEVVKKGKDACILSQRAKITELGAKLKLLEDSQQLRIQFESPNAQSANDDRTLLKKSSSETLLNISEYTPLHIFEKGNSNNKLENDEFKGRNDEFKGRNDEFKGRNKVGVK